MSINPFTSYVLKSLTQKGNQEELDLILKSESPVSSRNFPLTYFLDQSTPFDPEEHYGYPKRYFKLSGRSPIAFQKFRDRFYLCGSDSFKNYSSPQSDQLIDILIALYACLHVDNITWCDPFIKSRLDLGFDKQPALSFAWAKLVESKNWDTQTQYNYLLSKYQISDRSEWISCPITNILVPKSATEDQSVKGNVVRILASDKLNCLGQWKTLWYDYDELRAARPGIGFIPKETPLVPVYLSSNDWFGDLPIKYYPKELKACTICHKYTDIIYSKQILCKVCLDKTFPLLKIRPYSDNVLKHISPSKTINQKAVFSYFQKPILMGCELEYHNLDQEQLDGIDLRMYFLDLLNNFVIFKEDGSLDRGGFEIVTIPATIDVHLDRFKSVFASLPSTVGTATKTGMHIHLDRKSVSPLTLGRMVDFMNLKSNLSFVELVAERKLTGYCRQDETLSWGAALTGNTERHVTLNLQKKITAEFRIFQSPLTFLSFAKNLEFVLALRYYMTAGQLNLTPRESRNYENFITFIKQKNHSKTDSRNEFPHLFSFLKQKGAL